MKNICQETLRDLFIPPVFPPQDWNYGTWSSLSPRLHEARPDLVRHELHANRKAGVDKIWRVFGDAQLGYAIDRSVPRLKKVTQTYDADIDDQGLSISPSLTEPEQDLTFWGYKWAKMKGGRAVRICPGFHTLNRKLMMSPSSTM